MVQHDVWHFGREEGRKERRRLRLTFTLLFHFMLPSQLICKDDDGPAHVWDPDAETAVDPCMNHEAHHRF